MVKNYTFNKRKNDTLILIHGLYTNSGFWLTYFNLFRDYRIVALDIDYEKLLNDNIAEQQLKDYLKALISVENIVAVISHSFGTVISDIVFEAINYSVFKICPVGFSNRLNSKDFMLDIGNKTTMSQETINQYMQLVSVFVAKVRGNLNYNGLIYIPKQDNYFSYRVPQNKTIEFDGDHFNVGEALRDIINHLSSHNSTVI